ncbi:hypothetical protein IT774_04995 [Salinimonas marina]|uniref:Uncharacterized protein n=1 Tax=Salinimonas marina TaxID=2785918 RepID=A0A7S9HDR1_9ALTE|nr:hypothetical protein [Salinimonas marina]QPG06531.1 hypothetical protein IT774_04995 [Salinimonas marina]
MFEIVNTTKLGVSNKLIEQQLMLKVRFAVLMYQTMPSERSKSRLLQAMTALNHQLNVFGPSDWLKDNYTEISSLYAGFFWLVVGRPGQYRILMDDKPETSTKSYATNLSLVK